MVSVGTPHTCCRAAAFIWTLFPLTRSFASPRCFAQRHVRPLRARLQRRMAPGGAGRRRWRSSATPATAAAAATDCVRLGDRHAGQAGRTCWRRVIAAQGERGAWLWRSHTVQRWMTHTVDRPRAQVACTRTASTSIPASVLLHHCTDWLQSYLFFCPSPRPNRWRTACRALRGVHARQEGSVWNRGGPQGMPGEARARGAWAGAAAATECAEQGSGARHHVWV